MNQLINFSQREKYFCQLIEIINLSQRNNSFSQKGKRTKTIEVSSMQYPRIQSGSKKTNSNTPTDGYEDIETLFGLKVRVKKGTIQDQEILMLSNLNRCLFAVGYEKVLQVPSNFEILTTLRNSQKKDFYKSKKNEGQKNQSETKQLHAENKVNLQQESALYERKTDQNSNKNRDSLEEQKYEWSVVKKQYGESRTRVYERNEESVKKQEIINRQQQQSSQPQQQYQSKQVYASTQSQIQQNKPARTDSHHIQPYQQKKQDYSNQDVSSYAKPQPQQFSPSEHLKPARISSQLDQKFSRLAGWFFVDRREEISSAHSLQNNDFEKKYWKILGSIWDQISFIKNKTSLKDLNLTQEAMNLEQHELKSTQACLSKCNFWMSKMPFILSSTPLESIDISTIQSQKDIYRSFDLRVIFTENDNTNCLRALIFGLLYYTLAFEKPYNTILEIIKTIESVTIKLVIFHILVMQAQQKLSVMQLAINLSLLLRFNQFSNSLLRFFIKQLPKGCNISDSETVIQHFAAKFNCNVIFQNISPLGSMIKMTNPGEQKDNVIFLDITQKGCALNLVFQEEKLTSCMNIYKERLGQKFILPSI